MLRVSGTRRGEYGLRHSSDKNLSSLAVDVEGQMARFGAKTLRLCSGLVVLMGTEAAVAVTGEVSFDNRNKHRFEE